MDAHITAHLPVEEESPAPSARLRGETVEPFLTGGFREENPEPCARLPGETEELPLGEGFGECSGGVVPNSGERLPATPPWWKRRQILLPGAAVIALGTAGASAFLVSTYNHVYPVPQMTSTAEMGIRRTEPLAPAASLASVPTEPGEPVIREKYQPKGKDQQLHEVLALHRRTAEGLGGDGQQANPPPSSPAPSQDAQSSRLGAAAARLCAERARRKPGVPSFRRNRLCCHARH